MFLFEAHRREYNEFITIYFNIISFNGFSLSYTNNPRYSPFYYLRFRLFVITNKNSTVKLVYNDHPRDPKFVAVVDRLSLFRGRFTLWKLKLGLQNSGRCRQVVAIRRWSGLTVFLIESKLSFILYSIFCYLRSKIMKNQSVLRE